MTVRGGGRRGESGVKKFEKSKLRLNILNNIIIYNIGLLVGMLYNIFSVYIAVNSEGVTVPKCQFKFYNKIHEDYFEYRFCTDL